MDGEVSTLQNYGLWLKRQDLYFLSTLSLLSQTDTKVKENLKYQTGNYPRRARAVTKHVGTIQEQPRAKVNCLSKTEAQTLELNLETWKRM